MISNSRLRKFIDEYLREKNLTVKAFCTSLSGVSLSQNAIHELLKSERKVNESTQNKIAKIVFSDLKAELSDLEIRIRNWENSVKPLRIATGFTTWSSFIISLINEQAGKKDQLEDIEFVFCNDQDGNPFWIRTNADLNKIKSDPDKYPKYIANHLFDLFNKGEIDCGLLLRPTFDSLYKSGDTNKPYLVNRILIGNGTHLYVIEKQGRDNKSMGPQINANENVVTDDAKSICLAKEKFIQLVEGKEILAGYIGNKTIEREMLAFLAVPEIKNAVNNRFKIDSININDEENIDAFINTFLEEYQIFLVFAFAPLNNIIYHRIFRHSSAQQSFKYYNFNLSKMVEEKSSYNLYVSPSAFADINKMKAIVRFMEQLDRHIQFKDENELTTDISLKLADLYYPDISNNDMNQRERMENDLRDLKYSNQYLETFRELVNMLERRQK